MKMNLRTNYHKLALATSLPLAGYLGASIWVDAARLDQDFARPLPERGAVADTQHDLGLPGAARVERAVADPGRADLFTGEPMHVLRGVAEPLDLTDPQSPQIHPPIPNIWWVRHGVDPGFADSPQRDADRDGFSNLEEFRSETDPGDFASHPPLIRKLRVAALEAEGFVLVWTTHTCVGAPTPDDTYGFRYRDTAGRRNSQVGIPAGRGAASSFFADAPGQLRLELKAVRLVQALDPRINAARANFVATLIDRRANKNGREYALAPGDKLLVRDYEATFFLDAVGEATNRFELEENSSFSLPFDANSAAKRYRFVGVRDMDGERAVVIEFDRNGESEELLLRVPRD